MPETIYTIGHSTHPIERFIAVLKSHGVTALGDVRSHPYSRMNPQFDRDSLQKVLRESGIAYVFLGLELGARTEDPSCYDKGKVQYGRLAKTDSFSKGIDRVRLGMKDYKIALMCAEKEPLECHRTILVARYLEASGFSIQHILHNGQLESHADALMRLIHQLDLSENDMFLSRDEVLLKAYQLQGDRIAYSLNDTFQPDAQRSKQAAG